MKVVHILNSDKFSGAERVAILIIHCLYQQGIDAYYVSPRGDIEKRLKEENIKYYPVDKMSPANMRKMQKDLQPDIVHAHDYTTSVICALSLKKPILSHLHNNSPWIKRPCFYSWLYAISAVRYKKIFLVSDAILKEYIFAKWIAKKCAVVGNPVRTNEILKKSREPVECAEYDIIFVGRLSEPKNPFLLLDVVYELKKYFPGLRVCMIGDGELRSDLECRCKKLGLEDHVAWKGFLENPFPYVRQSKVFLIPSLWEGFGLAAAEALALGKPVVCTNVGGLRNIVDKNCGFLCEDKDGLIQACKTLLEDVGLYETMSSMALRKAKKMDNEMYYMKKIVESYQEIHNKR